MDDLLSLMVKARLAMICNIIINGALEAHLEELYAQEYVNRSEVELLVAIIKKFLEAKPLVEELVQKSSENWEAFKNAPKN